jgi:hypothetical protein
MVFEELPRAATLPLTLPIDHRNETLAFGRNKTSVNEVFDLSLTRLEHCYGDLFQGDTHDPGFRS